MQFLNAVQKLVSVTPANPLPVTPSVGVVYQVRSRASDGLATNQITVAATATVIVAARAAGRNSVTITNLGTVDVFIGGVGVTVANGHLLPGVKGASITLPFSGALFGIAASGTQAVSFVETF